MIVLNLLVVIACTWGATVCYDMRNHRLMWYNILCVVINSACVILI